MSSKSFKQVTQDLNVALATFRSEQADTMAGFNAMAKAMGADHTIAAGVLATLEQAVQAGAGPQFIPLLVDAIGQRKA